MSDKKRPASYVSPYKTVYEVQEEAARRSKEAGRYIRYAHIQIEETVQLYSGWKLKYQRNKNQTKEEKQ